MKNENKLQNIDGKKVKINVDKILERKNSERFINFLNGSRDKVFTAILDVNNHYTMMYTLKEDTSEVKWLFWVEDLILM